MSFKTTLKWHPSRSSQDYLLDLYMAIEINNNFLKQYENFVEESQRSVKELAVMKEKMELLSRDYGRKYSWKCLLFHHVLTCIIEFVYSFCVCGALFDEC
ncbi:hypothetical protein KSF78_0009469 [Schistosoma japonicum]|nr:hypothetical protein KSF78_0009469 [Schistosoma japonicum]KAH8857239.1 hypothetical protein KSF78_0009469 [Schistosoma japonicum]